MEQNKVQIALQKSTNEAKTELKDALKLGEQFRATREAKGLSLMQITDILEIRSYLLNDMEKGRFAHMRLGDCLAYAKLLGIDADLVKAVHALAVKQKQEVQNSTSKLKLYVGVGVMSASILIMCLLLAKSNDVKPSGDGLINVESAKIDQSKKISAPKIKEETASKSNVSSIQVANIATSNDAGSTVNLENVAETPAYDLQHENQPLDTNLVTDEISSKTQVTVVGSKDQIGEPNNEGNVELKVSTQTLDTVESLASSEEVNVNLPIETENKTLDDTKGQIKEVIDSTQVEHSNIALLPKKDVTTSNEFHASKQETKQNVESKSQQGTKVPQVSKQTVKKPRESRHTSKKVVKNNPKVRSKTNSANNYATTPKVKPLAYGEVRSLASEITPNTEIKEREVLHTKKASEIKSTVTGKKSSSTSQNAPKVVSPSENGSSKLKLGEVKSLSEE